MQIGDTKQDEGYNLSQFNNCTSPTFATRGGVNSQLIDFIEITI